MALKGRGPQKVLLGWSVREMAGSPPRCTGTRIALSAAFTIDVACEGEGFGEDDGEADQDSEQASDP
jgi:hypothetical protein